MPTKIVLEARSNVFNPLKALSATTPFKAEAAVQNMIAGVCPKCGRSMTGARIANGDDVFWCGTCCVASPRPDAA